MTLKILRLLQTQEKNTSGCLNRSKNMSELKGKWVLSAEYIEGKRLVFDITFVKEDVLERYQALHQSTKHILGETRYEYIDEYSEVCEMLDDIAKKYLSR